MVMKNLSRLSSIDTSVSRSILPQTEQDSNIPLFPKEGRRPGKMMTESLPKDKI